MKHEPTACCCPRVGDRFFQRLVCKARCQPMVKDTGERSLALARSRSATRRVPFRRRWSEESGIVSAHSNLTLFGANLPGKETV